MLLPEEPHPVLTECVATDHLPLHAVRTTYRGNSGRLYCQRIKRSQSK